MADINNIYGEVPLELQPQMQDISQQQKLSQLLLQQGMQQPQGQMVSGHYVKPALTQYLQPLFAAYAGNKGMETAEQKQLDLAKAIREIGGQETTKILELAKTDPNAAMAIAANAQTPQGKAFAPALMQNVLPKKTNELINFEAAKEGGFKGTFDEWRNQLTSYQKEELRLQNARLGIEYANQNKPQIVETANGYVAVNPRNPNQAIPVMLNGQPVVGSKGNLPEGAAGQVTGVQNVKSALGDLKNNLKTFTTFDMANPNKRALMATDYENTILQLKEAMKLGVLNGNDYAILTSMITDPNSPKALLLSKETQMKQINNLEKKLDEMTSNVYKTHQKTVPSNLQTPSAPNAPQIDPALLQYMTPEQRKLFGG